MISFNKRKHTSATFILAILGDYGRVESALARSIQCLEEIARRSDCRLVAALEDPRWETVPLVQTLGMRFPADRLTVVCGDYTDQPARLLSAAAERAEGDFLHFLWPGCLPDLDAVGAACAAAEAEDSIGWPSPVTWPTNCPNFAPRVPATSSIRIIWPAAVCFPSARPWCGGRASWRSSGFDLSPLLQREFDADFWLRSVRQGQKGLVQAGSLAEACWTWEDFPLQNDFRVPRYLSHSYRVRAAGHPSSRRNVMSTFVADLPPTLRRTVSRLTGGRGTRAAGRRAGSTEEKVRSTEYGVPSTEQGTRNTEHGAQSMEHGAGMPPNGASLLPAPRSLLPAPRSLLPAAFRIAVTGGPWEFAHNQLCFFNHFAQLEGQGLFTYVPLLDRLIEPERDLRDIDAVIISRGRHENLRKVLDYCQRQSIPTMYMIDDNWFWVGKDWPEPYATIFAPGLPQYEMFLSCLRECDAVLVYSDVLAEDVRPHARRVIRLPVNVRQADFAAPLKHAELKGQIECLTQWRQQTGGLVAGYIGSLRYSDGAFRALAASTGRHSLPVKAVLFGVISEQHRQLFNGEAAVLPYVGYDDYAAAVGALVPDILVAPLDTSRTSMSKCPNKYLEYSIAGAAGIYSDTPPYSQTVIDGRTGLLVGDDDEATWSAAIARLVEDAPLRQSIAAAARRDVLQRFETGVVAPAFAQALLSLIRESGRQARHKIQERAAC